MNEFKIQSTATTPEVIFNPGGAFKIKGRSIHENIMEFFKPLNKWLDDYIKAPADVTCVDICLEYFNSATAKMLIKILQKITEVQFRHKKFLINWYYEEGDEDVLEKGEYFSSVLKIPFNFIKVV
jgi:hypothetical protein